MVLMALTLTLYLLSLVGGDIFGWTARTEVGLLAAGSWLAWITCVMEQLMAPGVVFGAEAAYFTYLWWKKRKGRGKKALKQLGAKSRALVEALVRQMTPIPSPVGGGVS